MKAVHVISGTAVPLKRSDVDTDQIIPSDWLKRVSRTGFGDGLFSEWREGSDFVLNQARYDGASILVAGPNFGTGSSREHAVWALLDYGFKAVMFGAGNGAVPPGDARRRGQGEAIGAQHGVAAGLVQHENAVNCRKCFALHCDPFH